MEVFATLGKGFSADNKFKLEMFSRVDTGSAPTSATIANYNSILSGQNTTLHTFNERGRVKVADVRPQFLGYGTPTSYQFMLPNSLQWFELNPFYFPQQIFRGVSIATGLPDETITPASLGIQLTVSITFKFRGRVISPKAFGLSAVPVTDILATKAMNPGRQEKPPALAQEQTYAATASIVPTAPLVEDSPEEAEDAEQCCVIQ
jgi:hypothetical protein